MTTGLQHMEPFIDTTTYEEMAITGRIQYPSRFQNPTSGHNFDLLSPFCRICHESCEELIAPCRCRGTARYVHRDCLNSWRDTRGGKLKYRCEICLTNFRFELQYPSFWSFVKNHWTIFEKMTYSSSLFSSLFSIVVSLLAYKRDRVNRAPRDPNLRDTMKYRRIPLFLITELAQLFLYGWPANLKVVMTSCMAIVVIGNWYLFEQWRERNRTETILPHDPSDSSAIFLSKSLD
eukprot:TRINITY_DN12555_c0_g1_i1.p1 TRINITY_DN12555_c0_g1~~TRINITY_DN12555_c0_g1_i1.p1  ORF type:complete len:234 (-),score=2.55 TRINITY_DN12555_c0_g1_i1:175-876(-)